MRHTNAHRKFSMTSAHRRALLRNLATALVDHGEIQTTYERAKELQGVVEKLVTDAKSDTLASRRRVGAYLTRKESVHRLFTDVVKKFESRAGGYTRVLRTAPRVGDNAQLAVIQFVA